MYFLRDLIDVVCAYCDWPELNYFGFSYMTLNCQSLYSLIRLLLESHETKNISVRGYDCGKETENRRYNIRKKIKVFCRDFSSNAITSLPQVVFANLTNLRRLWVLKLVRVGCGFPMSLVWKLADLSRLLRIVTCHMYFLCDLIGVVCAYCDWPE